MPFNEMDVNAAFNEASNEEGRALAALSFASGRLRKNSLVLLNAKLPTLSRAAEPPSAVVASAATA